MKLCLPQNITGAKNFESSWDLLLSLHKIQMLSWVSWRGKCPLHTDKLVFTCLPVNYMWFIFAQKFCNLLHSWISWAFSEYLVLASVRQDFRLAELFLWLKNNTFFDNFLQDFIHLGENILLLYVSGMRWLFSCARQKNIMMCTYDANHSRT